MTTDRISAAKDWKQIVKREMFEYLFNFAFLAVFLVAFAWYRRLILAKYHIEYSGYWAPLIEAARQGRPRRRLGRRLVRVFGQR